MALRLAVGVLIPALVYVLSNNTLLLVLCVISAPLSSVYYAFFSRSHRNSSFQFLTSVLLLAVIVLGKLKGIGSPGAIQLSLALLFSPLLDFRKFMASLPFWFFTAWAVGEIFSIRYGQWGYLLSLVVVPIVWRYFKGGKVQKAE